MVSLSTLGITNTRAIDRVVKTLNTSKYNHATRGGMPTDYTFSSSDICHLNIHSEWTGETHGVVDDNVIPLNAISLSQELDAGSYFFYVKCEKNKDCIKVSGENTGEKYSYMYPQSFIYGGKSEKSYQFLKNLIKQAIAECKSK